jgi:hypothetical protein
MNRGGFVNVQIITATQTGTGRNVALNTGSGTMTVNSDATGDVNTS